MLCSDHDKPDLIYTGPGERDEGQRLLVDEDALELEDKPFVYRTWSRRDPSQRTHPLWTRVKTAATIGCVCLLSYGLVIFSHSMHLTYVFTKKFIPNSEYLVIRQTDRGSNPPSTIAATHLSVAGMYPRCIGDPI